MTGRERIIKILNHEVPDRAPWLPYIGVHGGRLIGERADHYLQSSTHIANGLLKAVHIYEPDGLPILFDLQLEAERIGCALKWFSDSTPSVVSHPFEKVTHIPEFDKDRFLKRDGRLEVLSDAIRKFSKEVGDRIAVYGLICGPLTLAVHLRGEEMFFDLIMENRNIQDLLEYTASVTKAMVDFYRKEGLDIIGIVDPLVSLISPKLFTKVCSPVLQNIVDYIKDQNAYAGLFVCGNATKQLEQLCKVNPHFIAVDEQVDFEYAKKMTESHNIVLAGNIPVSTLLLNGAVDDILYYRSNLINKYGEAFMLATGCDVPYETPINHLTALNPNISLEYTTNMMDS